MQILFGLSELDYTRLFPLHFDSANVGKRLLKKKKKKQGITAVLTALHLMRWNRLTVQSISTRKAAIQDVDKKTKAG
jgi:hypothetical protein